MSLVPRDLENVYAARKLRLVVVRFIAVTCSEWYVDQPLFSRCVITPRYCGKGRSAWATLRLVWTAADLALAAVFYAWPVGQKGGDVVDRDPGP